LSTKVFSHPLPDRVVAHWLIVLGMIILGFLLGRVFQTWVESHTDKIKVAGETWDVDLPTFLGEVFYFSALFSVPLSGNLPLTGIVLAMFLYVLFGQFGRGPTEKGDPEDSVGSKWHRMFP